MKAYEFPVTITPGGKFDLPDEVIKILPDNQTVRIIILVDEPTDNAGEVAWSRLTAEQFLKGYDEVDSIYDQV